MSETRFTPGPWETDFFNVKGHNVYWVKDSLNRGVCECFIQYPFAGKPGITGDEAEANAFLYAAAPDMYAFLEKLVNQIEENGLMQYDVIHNGENWVLEEAKELLIKVRGESEAEK